MRVPIYTVAVPLFAALAFAQDTPPPAPQQPTETAAPASADKKSKDKSKDKSMDKDMDKDKASTAAKATGDRLDEMKTETYSGTLMDASCAGSGSTPSAPAASSASSADRAAPSADNKSCSVSASTTQFALKLKDGKTVKFDDVGNIRAQEAFKVHKKWSDSATASKPVRVKAGGILNGDQMTVISID